MHRYFSDNVNLERHAFELFGQGTLYDMNVNPMGQLRRPPEYRIHKMDGSTASYREFSRFVRIAELLGLPSRTNYNSKRWLRVDRYIGLAAQIDLLVDPAQSTDRTNPGNSSINDVDLTNFQNNWLALSFEQIDAELAQLG